MVRRRNVLRTAGLTSAVALAGCLGLVDSEDDDSDDVGAGGDWPMYQGDAQNTGAVDGTTFDSGLQQRWEFETDGAIVSNPAITNATVYFGNTNATAYALDVTSGTVQWDHTVETRREKHEVRGGVAATSEMVYFTAQEDDHDGTIQARDAATGELEWQLVRGAMEISPTVVGNRVYFGDYIYTVYGRKGPSGEELWKWRPERDGPDGVRDAPVLVDDTLYVTGGDKRLTAMEASTGAVKWRERFPGAGATGGRLAVPDGDTVVVNGGDTVSGIDRETSDLQWEVELEERAFGHPVGRENTVYVVESDGYERSAHVHALSVENGGSEWSTAIEYLPTSGVVLVGDTLIFGIDAADAWDETDAKVVGHDTSDGSRQWSFDVGAEVTSPLAVANGALFAGLEDGRLLALEPR